MRLFTILFLVVIVSLGALSATGIAASADHNLLAVDLLKTWTEDETNPEILPRLAGDAFPAYQSFYLGLYALKEGDSIRANDYWTAAIQGGLRDAELVKGFAPKDRGLAKIAVQTYPHSSLAWVWLGDASQGDPEGTLAAYLRAADLSPYDNLLWERIADLAERLGKTDLALHAAGRACIIYRIRNGSCLRAARLAFDKGDWESVIFYYELGYYPESAQDWAKLIRAAQHLGNTDEGQAYLIQAEQEYPADYPSLLEALP